MVGTEEIILFVWIAVILHKSLESPLKEAKLLNPCRQFLAKVSLLAFLLGFSTLSMLAEKFAGFLFILKPVFEKFN